MSPYLPISIMAVSAAALLAGISGFLYDYRRGSQAALLRRLGERNDKEDRNDVDDSLFRRMFAKEGEGNLSWQESLRMMIEHSGIHWSVGKLLTISAIIGVVSATVLYVLTKSELLTAIGGTLGLITPFCVIRSRHNSRQDKLLSQLPETFELIVRSVKAGQSVHAAIQMIANENRPPISTEFKRCCDQQNLGLPQDEAFRDLAHRNGVMELQIFAVAMLVQRQTGGSLVEILTNLSQLVRSRLRMQARIQALTGEARMQAAVLTLLPIVALISIYFLRPDYISVLFDRPYLIAGMVVANALGACWIQKLTKINY